MGLAFRLTLPSDTQFVCVGYIPELTASAIYTLSDSGLEIHDGGLDLQEFKNTVCQTQHESALNKAIDAGMVTLLNPLSFEAHTFPFGDARKRAVITIDDFKRFAETLQIEVVIEPPAFSLAPNNSADAKAYLTIDEAASAIAKKYGFNTPTTDTMREQLSAAADNGELTVRHPHTLLPYKPDTRRNFYELVSVTHLNAWLKKQGAEYLLDEVLTRDTQKPSLTIDDVTYSTAGLNIFDATEALAEKYLLDKPAKDNLLERLLEAAHRGELIVRDSSGFPYKPLHAEKHYYMLERISTDDLNAWLEKLGGRYRLDNSEREDSGNLPTLERVREAGEIPGKLPRREAGKLAVKAAWQIECETKRRAGAKEVMARLQEWADNGKEPATLIKSLPDKRAVKWRTQKAGELEYDQQACATTLKKWNESRQ